MRMKQKKKETDKNCECLIYYAHVCCVVTILVTITLNMLSQIIYANICWLSLEQCNGNVVVEPMLFQYQTLSSKNENACKWNDINWSTSFFS